MSEMLTIHRPTSALAPIDLSGRIVVRGYGESDGVLFVYDAEQDEREPLAEYLEERIRNRQVSVRYWVTDEPCTKDEAAEQFLRRLDGDADVRFAAHYSELTGYLWTDEDLNIGGHDLLAELKSSAGKWLNLEIR